MELVRILRNIIGIVAKKILAKNPNSPEIALINYSNTPRKELDSPNQRALSRNIRCSLPTTTQSLEPKVQTNVTNLLRKERETQKKFFDKGSKEAKLPEVNSKVVIQDPKTKKWTPGTVTALDPHPRSLIVRTNEDGEYRRNLKFVNNSKVHPIERSLSPSWPFNIWNQFGSPQIPTQATQSTIHQQYQEDEEGEEEEVNSESEPETPEPEFPPSQFDQEPSASVPLKKPFNPTIKRPRMRRQNSRSVSTESSDEEANPAPIITRVGRQIKPPSRLNL